MAIYELTDNDHLAPVPQTTCTALVKLELQNIRRPLRALRPLHSSTIEVVLPDSALSFKAVPVLRMPAQKLGVSLLNGAGGSHNTRRLGELVIKAIRERGADGEGDPT